MTDPVLVTLEGRVGRLTLNRPEALHALTLGMCQIMTDALLCWRDDAAVELVLLDHTGPRGFCAGGDIRMLAESGAGDGAEARAFFHLEYRLNHLLMDYPKPVVALMDGVVMGGGVNGAVNTAGTTGGATSAHMWALNTNYLYFRPHRDRNFVAIGGERQAVNQDAIVKFIGWAGNLTCSGSEFQGVLIA